MPISPERKAALKDALDKEKPNFSKFDEHSKEQKKKWADEIEMLEQRVKEDFVDVELSGGQTIKLHTRLSVRNAERIDALRLEQSKIQGDSDRLRAISYEIVEIVTANPLITKKWLQANPDKFSLDDVLSISFGYYEQQNKIVQNRLQRIADAKKFRPVETG
jgi:hypothetical protein